MLKAKIISIVSIVACSNSFANGPVQVCDGSEEFPPFAYYERINGEINKNNIIGIAPDLLKEIDKISGMKHEISLIPWERCLDEVANFKEYNNYEIVTNASFEKTRTEKYWFPASIYETKMGFIYSQKYHPDLSHIKLVKDLNSYNICGLQGYDYDVFFKYGLKRDIDTGSNANDAVISKIVHGRCDFFILDSVESFYAAAALGQIPLDPDLKVFRPKELPPQKFYIMISKDSPRAYELSAGYSQAISLLVEQGIISSLMKSYQKKIGIPD